MGRDLTACIEFSMPLPPSLNARYEYAVRKDKGGRVIVRPVLSESAQSYQDSIGYVAIQACHRAVSEPAPPFRLDVWLDMPDALRKAGREIDADNALKVICDGVATALHFNDREIMEIHVYKRRGATKATCKVRLSWGADALTLDGAA